MKLKILIIFLFCAILNICQGQYGYLGNKNEFGVNICSVPTLKKTNKLSDDGLTSKIQTRWSYTSYGLSLSRVIRKKLKIGVKYRYAQATVQNYPSLYYRLDTIYTGPNSDIKVSETRLNFLKDPLINLHFFSIHAKIYKKGSSSPLGKYMGFEFEHGFGSFLSTENIYVGKTGIIEKKSLIFQKQEVIEIDTLHAPNDINGTLNALFFLIGRSYALNDNLIINVGARFPIMRLITVDNYTWIGWDAQRAGGAYNANSSFNSFMYSSMGKHTRISINFGLNILF